MCTLGSVHDDKFVSEKKSKKGSRSKHYSSVQRIRNNLNTFFRLVLLIQMFFFTLDALVSQHGIYL